jgi:hypothetical protein
LNSELWLYKNSSKVYRIEIPNVQPDALVTKAWFTVKTSIDDLDVDAILFKEVDTVASADGQVVNSGSDGTAIVEFVILSNDLSSALTNRTYISAVKLLLSDDLTFVPPRGIRPVKVFEGVIERNS